MLSLSSSLSLSIAPILIFIGPFGIAADAYSFTLQAELLRFMPPCGVSTRFVLDAERLFRGEPALLPRFGMALGFIASALIASIFILI